MIIRIPCSIEFNENFLNFSSDNSDEQNPSVRMEILHDGVNPKGTSFTKEAIDNAKETLYDKPILAYVKYDENGEPLDFGEHEIIIVSKIVDGKRTYEYKYIEQPIGTFSRNFDIEYQKNENGKEYLVATGTIWKRYCKDAYELLQESDKSISMEIEILSSEKDKDTGILNISNFNFLGVTILGDEYEPGIDGANATLDFTKIKSHEELLNYLNNIEQNDAKGDRSMKKNEMNFSLSLDEISRQIGEQLSERKIEKEYSWGEKYTTREFYYRDIIPDDSIVVVSDCGYKHYGIPYTMSNDSLSLAFDDKREYIREWREKKSDGEATFSLDDELVKDMTYSAEIERVNTKAKEVIEGTRADLTQANQTIFAKDEEIKELNETVTTLTDEVGELKGKLEEYSLKEAELLKAQREEEVEKAIEKFSFTEEETSEMKEQCLNGEFDLEELNNKLFALYGKKEFEKMTNRKPSKEDEGINYVDDNTESKHLPYKGYFEK